MLLFSFSWTKHSIVFLSCEAVRLLCQIVFEFAALNKNSDERLESMFEKVQLIASRKCFVFFCFRANVMVFRFKRSIFDFFFRFPQLCVIKK